MRLFFFYDANFKPLRDNLVETLQEAAPHDFDLQEDFIEDLGVMKNRAGGGVPTYLYKAQKIKDALDAVPEGEVFVFCDVDIQFFAPVRHIVEEAVKGVDLVLQREFEDIGVNIGFLAIRNTPATHRFWAHIHAEITRTQALDQRVVNNTLYSGMAKTEFGLDWGRFPLEVWASSMAQSGRIPPQLVLHHANFTIERCTSYDPSVKLAQMAEARRHVRGESDSFVQWVAAVQADSSMADYRDRHFGARRPGPEWHILEPGHIARAGGFKEKRGAAAAKEPAS
ncbi:unnamed protein product [Polarella glacialis]|uniref:Nucleotide-diphospho-sugar transferase domain-containing protein n=1 Tax=Polarella glacialis TaxID=89957 RepID=A0A813D9M2_POLGL|nr:unnamed protein product [Polarella glacialis]